jgi:hypothetical protein
MNEPTPLPVTRLLVFNVIVEGLIIPKTLLPLNLQSFLAIG